MRVLSMLFIILGHSLLEVMHIAGYSNVECIRKNKTCLDASDTTIGSYLLLAGQLGVDTFFYIGGFLLSFIGKSRPMPVVMGTALRYARLLPLFGFIQMFYVLISPYLAFGPFAPRMQHEVFTECAADNPSWWSELLFINAFYPWTPLDGGCMGWSWYLGVDMVFAIIGLVMLNIWKMNKLVGWSLAIIGFVVCTIVSIQQVYAWNMQYVLLNPKVFETYSINLYNRPYHRFPCFLIGLVAPWALDIAEKRGLQRGTQPTSMRAKIVVWSACLLALAVVAACIFLPWTNANGPGPVATARKENTWTTFQNAMYISFVRPAWTLCWLVWTLACYFDYTPVMNAVFAHPIMTPLASLTFGAYLMHPVIIKIVAGNVDGNFRYSPGEAIQRAIIFAILAYCSAIVTWCLVEKPMATMTGWLLPKKKRRSESPTKQNAVANSLGDIERPA
jgi:hypothetical protein